MGPRHWALFSIFKQHHEIAIMRRVAAAAGVAAASANILRRPDTVGDYNKLNVSHALPRAILKLRLIDRTRTPAPVSWK